MKKIVNLRVMAVVLCFTLLLSIVDLFGISSVKGTELCRVTESIVNPSTDDKGLTTWDCIYFGSYPQSKYSPKQFPTNPESGKEYTDSDGTKMVYIEGVREEYDEEKYSIVDVPFQEYYKVEPIKWRVLSINGSDAFLLSDQSLDCQPYNDASTSVLWENSSLQKWLNTNFLKKAFSDREQFAIMPIRREIAKSSSNGDYNDSCASEKISILSQNEIADQAYGFCSDFEKQSKTRIVKNSQYAEACGAATFHSTIEDNERCEGNGMYWLRRANNAYMYFDGQGLYRSSVYSENIGVRPILHINLNYSSLWSFAGEVNVEGEIKEAEPTKVPVVTPTPLTTETEGNQYGIDNPSFKDEDTVYWDCLYFGVYPQEEYTPKRPPMHPISETVYEDSDGTKMLYKEGIIEKYDEQTDSCNEIPYSKYFKIAPIKWRVLSIGGDVALLLADKNLDCRAYLYQESSYATWEMSGLQRWLNYSFRDKAFTDLEKESIIRTEVYTEFFEGSDGSTRTKDDLFLLSIDDMCNNQYGFISDSKCKSKSRMAKNTSYAKYCGAWTQNDGEEGDAGWWWLRSLGNNCCKVQEVSDDGAISMSGAYRETANYAVRPALRISLSNTDVWKKAGKISSEGKVILPTATPTETPTATPENHGSIPTVNPTKGPTPKPMEQPEDYSNKNAVVIGTTLKDASGGTYKVLTEKSVVYMKPVNKSVSKVVIPPTITDNGVTFVVSAVSKNVFAGCTKLKSVSIGKNVTSIGDKAFYNCRLLSKITIPAKVTRIGKQAFANCKKIKMITIKSAKLRAKTVGAKAFKGIYKKTTVKVPKKQKKLYKKLLIAKGLTKKAKIK